MISWLIALLLIIFVGIIGRTISDILGLKHAETRTEIEIRFSKVKNDNK